MQIYEHVPDSVKLVVAAGPPGLFFLGLPVEHWILIMSAIASVLVIIEKIPKAIDSILVLIERFKNGNSNK